MIPCTPGKLCDTVGLYDLSSSTYTCPERYYCMAGSYEGSSQKVLCPDGYYCPAGSALPHPCPAGKYDNQPGVGLRAESDCENCPVNYFCPLIAQTQYFTANICEAGFVCAAGSVHGRVTICEKGYKCPQSDVAAIACDPNNGEY